MSMTGGEKMCCIPLHSYCVFDNLPPFKEKLTAEEKKEKKKQIFITQLFTKNSGHGEIWPTDVYSM